MAHLRDHKKVGFVRRGAPGAGQKGVFSRKGLGDDAARPGTEHGIADEPVGVGDVGDLQVGDDGQSGRDLPDDSQARGEDERIADLDCVEVVAQLAVGRGVGVASQTVLGVAANDGVQVIAFVYCVVVQKAAPYQPADGNLRAFFRVAVRSCRSGT